MSDSDDRQMGVELGDINDALESHSYPASAAELTDDYGDRTIDLPNGSKTFGEILGPFENETYESAEEVRQSIFNMVGSEAVGREDYSDRGTTTDESDGESDQDSL